MNAAAPSDAVRLDKWLWAARFFKTRPLAVAAITGGKVEVDGHRAKPGRDIRPGTRLCIHKGSLAWEVEVLAVSTQRRPAVEAARLYQEDAASQARRADQLRQARESGPQATTGERPTKRDRRQFERITRDPSD